MNKIFYSIICLFLVFACVCYAEEGAADNDFSEDGAENVDNKLNTYIKVNGLENWDYEYDVSDLKRGRYNIIIQGKDMAGNIHYGGPINIFIDPESDLPDVSITNPTAGMRVGGSHLNIVGTCVDDDGVANVEIKINDGAFVEAEGTDFWSYDLSTEGLNDGKHTITARGIDINGKTGEELTRFFYIDTDKPIHHFTSKASGVLVSGKMDLEGYVTDLNGIDALFMSEDGGNNFERLGLKYHKDEDQYFFKLSIDTKRKEEGPHVSWFKSIDSLGSVGYAAFLFFVDNNGPEIEILYPRADEKVKGETIIAGSVMDKVGIQSLTYKWRDQTGEIPLIPGNPYWAKEFSFHGYNTREEVVAFTVTDTTGNVRSVNVKVQIDREADKPVVKLLSPQPDATTSGTVTVYGFISDDDSPASFVYTLDNREATTLPVKEGFAFVLDDLEPGKHRISYHGVDVYGIEGNKEKVDFIHMGSRAGITMESVISKEETTRFLPGISIGRYDNVVLRGNITAYERFKQVRCRIGKEDEKTLSLKNTSDTYIKQFDIPVSKSVPYGIVEFTITAIDVYERISEYTSFVSITNYTKRWEKHGMYCADARLDSGRIPLSDNFPFYAYFHGDKVASVTFEPDTNNVGISETNGKITVSPMSGSFDVQARIKVTTEKGEVFYSPSLHCVSDESYFSQGVNNLTITGAVTSEEISGFYPGMLLYCADGKAKLEGELSAAIAKGEYRLNNESYRKLTIKRKKGEEMGTFSLQIPQEVPFGRNEIEIKVYDDESGVASHKTFFFAVDRAGGEVNDREGLYFIDSRISADGSVSMTKDNPFIGFLNGREVTSVSLNPASDFLTARISNNHVIVEAQREGNSDKTVIQVTTADGRSFQSGEYIFLADVNPPELILEAPVTGDWIGERLLIKGKAHDNTGINNVEYSIDGGKNFTFLTMTREGDEVIVFEDIVLQGTPDGELTLVVRAQDGSNNTTHQTILLKKDTEQPDVSIITPEVTRPVNGTFTVTGIISDTGRITKVEFSDSGEKYEALASDLASNMFFHYDLDLAQYETIPEKFFIRATDAGDNAIVIHPEFTLNFEADKPVVAIQIPEKDAVLRSDFIISGMVFDDDGVSAIYYRIDDNEFTKMDGGNSFSVPVELDDITDNEHTIEVQAEDIGGLKGDIAASTFFISKAEPVSQLIAPEIEITTQGIIELRGKSEDNNGIKEVYLSFDNGNSYNLMNGKEEWSYLLNTRLLYDGVHRILIKAVDNTGTEGIHATILHVDNMPPTLSLDAPFDGQIADDTCLIDGRAFDNIFLKDLALKIASLNAETGEESVTGYNKELKLTTDGIFSQWVDVSDLENGWYNLRFEARDRADNVTFITRNIRVQQRTVVNRIEQIFPTDGETLSGYFTLSGRVVSERPVDRVTLLVDDNVLASIDVDDNGYFNRECGGPEDMADGEHTIELTAALDDGNSLTSGKHQCIYSRNGAWIRITNLKTGDFITDRPWLKGEAGFFCDPVSKENGEAYKEYQQLLKKHKITRVEVSLDNGKTFKPASGTTHWKYRLETQNIADGDVRIMVRAVNQIESIVTRAIVNNDDLPPSVKILNPEEGKRFNDSIPIMGIASDENGLKDVTINLRRGDKSGYSIPEFIQGMYVDTQILGSTIWNTGLGLTFFDQNVRLQFQFGIAPPGRFSGMVIGTKLIANVFKLPFDFLFGPDWEMFSMSLALGANFSYFTMSGEEMAFNEEGLLLSAVFVQCELARFHFKDMTFFNTYSLYTEFDLWVISADIEGGVVPKFSAGLRIGIL